MRPNTTIYCPGWFCQYKQCGNLDTVLSLWQVFSAGFEGFWPRRMLFRPHFGPFSYNLLLVVLIRGIIGTMPRRSRAELESPIHLVEPDPRDELPPPPAPAHLSAAM